MAADGLRALISNPDCTVKWRAVLAEYIGTLLFCFISCTTAVSSSVTEAAGAAQLLHVAVANAFAYAVLSHILGPISGAHVCVYFVLKFIT